MDPSSTQHVTPTHTVLVVDDNESARYSTARMLRAGGFATVETAGGAEALEMAGRGISAVVLDVHLPDLHGFEVCRLLRSQPATAGLPVIHISAIHVQTDDKVTGLRTGADAYLLSPVEPPVLVATVEALIRSRTKEGEIRRSDVRFRGVFENVACALAVVDHEGCFVEVNRALAVLLGLPRAMLEGRRLSTLAPSAWALPLQQLMARWDQPWRGEFPLRGPGGTTLNLGWSVTPHVEAGLRIAVVTPAAALH